jgi:hypothetical protein
MKDYAATLPGMGFGGGPADLDWSEVTDEPDDQPW